jgi:hypothetical protein
MQADDSDALRQRMAAVAARVNAGDAIPEVDPSRIEYMWETMSRFPRSKDKTVGLGAVAGSDPNAWKIDPEEQIAVVFRCKILEALIDRGVLNDFMKDEAGRNKVFAAAATLKCNRDDFGEAPAQESIREAPPEVREKMKKELRLAGCDPDHPAIVEKFIAWIH